MINVLNGPPFVGQNLGQARDATRLIRHLRHEAYKSLVRSEATVNHPAKRSGVDVTTAEGHHHLLALHLPVERAAGQDCGEAGGAAALNHELFRFDEPEHGQRNLVFAHQLDAIGILTCNNERVASDLRYCQSISQRWGGGRRHGLSSLERGEEGCAPLRLDADHTARWFQRFDSEGRTSQKASATARNNNVVSLRQLLEDLEAHRTSAGYDLGIVVSVDVLKPSELWVGFRQQLRLADVGAVDHNVGAKGTAPRDLRQRGQRRHEHGHRDAHLLAVPRKGERVVARRRRDHTDLALLLAGDGGEFR